MQKKSILYKRDIMQTLQGFLKNIKKKFCARKHEKTFKLKKILHILLKTWILHCFKMSGSPQIQSILTGIEYQNWR